MTYRVTIKELPAYLRPRERLVREGPESLSEVELLAIVLRSGTSQVSALDLAQVLLSRFGGLRGLLEVSAQELGRVHGMGVAKAAQVKAALELGRRGAILSGLNGPAIKSPQDVAALMMHELRHLDREHFCVLLLNTKNHVLYRETVAIGTLNSSTVHPRELFKTAVRRSAAAVILVHNHPSGDPTPSREDVELTARLREAGRILGIEVLDHVVIGDNKYVSLKAEGLM